MSDNTAIEWTDATWNPITGCSVTSPGCTNCYAMKLAGARLQHHPSRAGLTQPSNAGPVWTGETRLNEEWLTQPIAWRRPRRIFTCAHGDLFHESVPDQWIDRVFAVMALCPQHTFQVLTKRSARMKDYMVKLLAEPDHITLKRLVAAWPGIAWPAEGFYPTPDGGIDIPLPNVWLGVSVEDQPRADERIPDLLATPAAVRWLSCEPLLGPLDLREALLLNENDEALWFIPPRDHIDWVVAGGESGPGARPMHPDWPMRLRDQCAAAHVPFFFKQWGEWAPLKAFGGLFDAPISDRLGNVHDWMRRYVACDDRADRLTAHSFTGHATDLVYRVGKKRAGRLLDGVEHNGMPS